MKFALVQKLVEVRVPPQHGSEVNGCNENAQMLLLYFMYFNINGMDCMDTSIGSKTATLLCKCRLISKNYSKSIFHPGESG